MNPEDFLEQDGQAVIQPDDPSLLQSTQPDISGFQSFQADDQISQLLQTQHTELMQLMTDNHNEMIQAQTDSVTYLVSFMAGLVFAALLTYLLDRGVVK